MAKGILKFDFGIVKSGVEYKARLPMGRFGNPDEVALIALALASDPTSYVNGALIPVDGASFRHSPQRQLMDRNPPYIA